MSNHGTSHLEAPGANATPPPEPALAPLAEVLAHRLRGHVAGITGYADLLQPSLQHDDQHDLLASIVASADGIAAILDDLNAYSRPLHLVQQVVSVRFLLDGLLDRLPDAIAERLVLDMQHARKTIVDVDPKLMQEALVMVLANAHDATNHASSSLTLHVHQPTAGWLAIAIHNEGMIPLANAEEAVFTPFFTTKARNMGVGLAMARRIAEAHNGNLQLTCNSVLEGTTFVLALPCTAS